MSLEDPHAVDEPPPYAPGEDNKSSAPQSVPPRPLGPPKRSFAGNLLAIVVALLGVGLLAVLLIGCSGGNPAVLILLLGFCGFVLLHYVVWGWWLGRTVARRETARKEQNEN